MIRCASISDEEACARPKLVGHESDGVHQRVVEKVGDKLWKLHCADNLGLMEDMERWQLVVTGGRSGLEMSMKS